MGMRLRISRSLLDQLLLEAAGSPGAEICGLLFGAADRVTAGQRCCNVASDPATGFEIDPAALIAAHRAARNGGPAIAGCYHSHPQGPPRPSARDAASAAPDGQFWLILAGGAAQAYRAVPNGPVEGRFDPIELAVED